jgi:hypothetical protein
LIGLLVDPMAPLVESTITVLQEAARAKGVQLQILKASTESEIDAAFETLVQLAARTRVFVSHAAGLWNQFGQQFEPFRS